MIFFLTTFTHFDFSDRHRSAHAKTIAQVEMVDEGMQQSEHVYNDSSNSTFGPIDFRNFDTKRKPENTYLESLDVVVRYGSLLTRR